MTDKPLSEREIRFVTEYVGPANGVGAAAAKAAGYKGNAKTLTTQAQRMLAKASIQRAIADFRDQVKRDGVATAVDVAVRLTAIGMGVATEKRIITGKEGDFIDIDVPMPGATQVAALKALNAQMGYDAAQRTEVSGVVGVISLTAEQEAALDEWLLVRDDPRVQAVLKEVRGES
jgi:phage terminase small subunit